MAQSDYLWLEFTKLAFNYPKMKVLWACLDNFFNSCEINKIVYVIYSNISSRILVQVFVPVKFVTWMTNHVSYFTIKDWVLISFEFSNQASLNIWWVTSRFQAHQTNMILPWPLEHVAMLFDHEQAVQANALRPFVHFEIISLCLVICFVLTLS